jgi:hypothetical protein
MRTQVLVILITLAGPAAAGAGDTWLIADSSVINEGDALWLSVVSGDVFPYAEVPTGPERLATFRDLCGGEVREVFGYALRDGGLSIREPITACGTHVIGCALKPRLIEHAAGAVVERSTAFVKTVVEVQPADPHDAGYLAPLGHRLEIIPLSHPSHWQADSTVRVEVLLDGHPWPGVPVLASHDGLEERANACQTATDARGVASVFLTRSGHWFITAGLIRPTNGLEKAKYESFQASLTFRALGKTNVHGALRTIRAIHGGLDPWAVAGYRMGQRALNELDLPRDSLDLQALQGAPLGSWQTALADGIQAATGVRAEDINRGPEDPRAGDLGTVFTARSTGEAIVIRLRDDFLELISDVSEDESEAVALRVSILPDEEIFMLPPASGPLISPKVPDRVIGIARSDP